MNLHYVVVSALPNVSTIVGPVFTSMPMSTSSGQVSTIGQIEQKRRGRPRRPITDEPRDVTMTTGSVTMATGCSNVTHDSNTVPYMQQHCVIPAQPLQRSAASAPVNTAVKHTGSCVITESRHSAVTGESAQQHSVNSLQRHSAISGKCLTTHAVTTTAAQLDTTTHGMNECEAIGKSSVSDKLMYPTADCAVSMLWLADQPTLLTSSHDDDDADGEEAAAKLMMSSFHLIPLITAPHPYPCIEPMYVDMATVGMAAFGMPATGVNIATDDVVMAAAANNMAAVGMATSDVGMETANVSMPVACGLVSVDDSSAVAGWPTLYQCSDNYLSVATPPANQTSVYCNDGSVDASGNGQSKPAAAAVSIQPQSKLRSASDTGPVAANPSLTLLTNSADNPGGNPSLVVGGPFSQAQLRQQSCQDADSAAAAAADDDDADVDVQGVEMSNASRPDVVSSNIPRSYVATTTTTCSSGHANNHGCCSSSTAASCCSSVLDSHAATTTCSSSCSSYNACSSGVSVSEHHHHQQQQQQHDSDNVDNENDELDAGSQPDSLDQQPASSS